MRRQSKIQNPARGSKRPSRGGGVDLNFRGGGHKKSKQVGSTPLDTPLAHLCGVVNHAFLIFRIWELIEEPSQLVAVMDY